MNKHILIAEDEPHLAFNLEFNLKAEGFLVHLANNGKAAIDLFQNSGPFDLALIDVMMPEVNGFKVAEFIRSKNPKIPILMLTAKASDEDRVHGLELGADDYITKPFHLKELILKIRRALLRDEIYKDTSDHGHEKPMLVFQDYCLNREELFFETPQGVNKLTVIEADLLFEFMKNPDKVLSREHLLKTVWGARGHFETRTVDNFVMRLRKFFEGDQAAKVELESVRGRGYRFKTFAKSGYESKI